MAQFDNVISRILESGLDLYLIAFIIFILTNIIKKFIPTKSNNVIVLIPFMLGVSFYVIAYYFLLNTCTLQESIKTGLRVGGVSTLYYAIIKQLSSKNSNLSKNISNILKGIVSPATIKKTTETILKQLNLGDDPSKASEAIYNIIANSSSVTENECNALTSIVINAFEDLKNKK